MLNFPDTQSRTCFSRNQLTCAASSTRIFCSALLYTWLCGTPSTPLPLSRSHAEAQSLPPLMHLHAEERMMPLSLPSRARGIGGDAGKLALCLSLAPQRQHTRTRHTSPLHPFGARALSLSLWHTHT